jgi:hypothetical protein
MTALLVQSRSCRQLHLLIYGQLYGLHRFVALKFLPQEVATEPQALARFQREPQAALRVESPHHLHDPRELPGALRNQGLTTGLAIDPVIPFGRHNSRRSAQWVELH